MAPSEPEIPFATNLPDPKQSQESKTGTAKHQLFFFVRGVQLQKPDLSNHLSVAYLLLRPRDLQTFKQSHFQSCMNALQNSRSP